MKSVPPGRQEELPIVGCKLHDLYPLQDKRGSFTSLGEDLISDSIAFCRNPKQGTIRGMHYQVHPALQVKRVYCLRGLLYDVILDMRPKSPSYGKWTHVLLVPELNYVVVPAGCAHGYQTLEQDTHVLYMVRGPYSPQLENGVRYNDPHFQIDWPFDVTEVSEKDNSWPLVQTL